MSNNSAQSEFLEAAQAGDMEKARKLLLSGASVEGRANDDWTALTIAAREGHLDFVRFLVESGANINAAEGGGNTALFWAAYGGHLELVQWLVQNGADSRLKCDRCTAPARIARDRGHEEVAGYLDSIVAGEV